MQANASFVHVRSHDGVHEIILNLNRTFIGDPGRLASAITAARAEGTAYLIIHQGT